MYLCIVFYVYHYCHFVDGFGLWSDSDFASLFVFWVGHGTGPCGGGVGWLSGSGRVGSIHTGSGSHKILHLSLSLSCLVGYLNTWMSLFMNIISRVYSDPSPDLFIRHIWSTFMSLVSTSIVFIIMFF